MNDNNNLTVLVAARESYTDHLCQCMYTPMIESLHDIYKEAHKMSDGNESLKQYQKLLREVPSWNNHIIQQHTEKIIQKKVRQASSSRTDVMKTRSAKDKNGCNTKWSWNNQSSSSMASIINSNNVPSRGNSTRTSLTRHRPGASSAPGTGVDVKHNSYERYLLKRKNKNLSC